MRKEDGDELRMYDDGSLRCRGPVQDGMPGGGCVVRGPVRDGMPGGGCVVRGGAKGKEQGCRREP